MTFQTNVAFDTGFGAVGELAFDGPHRAMSGVLNSIDPAQNVIGRWFTRNNDGTFGAGGMGAEGGLLANPKVYASGGTAAGGTLAPTLTLRNGEAGEFVFMGEMVVSLDIAAVQGYDVHYNTATGELTAVYAGTAPASGYEAIPNAKVSRYAQSGTNGGLAVVRLTQ